MTRRLEINDLHVTFDTRYGQVRALDGVSLHVNAGETLCIVGESGCGKSVTALCAMGLLPSPPGKISAGEILLDGYEITTAGERALTEMRGRDIAMIFQEPMTSLNPVFTIGDQIAEAMTLHQNISRRQAILRAVELLDRVGIPAPDQQVHRYPHQFSGGMRQRAMIAMAISCQPKVLIADEPTTALDVTVQAQILDLLNEIQRDMGTAILMVTHDMGVVSEMSDRVAVMYAGRVIETGETDHILDTPRHPYTKGLIECIPSADHGATGRRLLEIPGVVPPLHLLGRGCAFKERCQYVIGHCDADKPELSGNEAHKAACHVVLEREPAGCC